MDLLLPLLRDGNSLMDESLSAIIKGKLELMIIEVARQLMPTIMEPTIRTVVKDELGKALEKVLPSMKLNFASGGSTSESPRLQLEFLSNIGPEVWTGKEKGKENLHIEVALIDGQTGEVVKSGPEAEAKVEIVALDGTGEGDSLTHEEFNKKIIREYQGKKLLRGNTYLKLKEGKASSRDISFTHNKDWMRNRKLRLGAKVDYVFPTIIKEGKTESFLLKDKRGNLNEKHYPPSGDDEVCRIEKIQRGGTYHNRLKTAKINTVKEFLTLLAINPERLQNILEVTATSTVWKTITDHAKTCLLNEGLYSYHDPSYERNTKVVFDASGRLMGLFIESQYVPVDQLTEDEKADGQKSVKSASEHWEDVVSHKDEAGLRHDGSKSATTVKSFPSLTQDSCAGANCRILPLVSDQGSPTGSNCTIPQLVSDQESPMGYNCRILPLVSDQRSLSGSNGRISSLVSDQESPTGSNCRIPLVSDQGCPAASNSRILPLVSGQDSHTGTSPLTNDHLQPSSSSLFTPSLDPSGSTNSVDNNRIDYDFDVDDNNDIWFSTSHRYDSPISSPDIGKYCELWQPTNSDHNHQPEIPNVEMHPDQQGSASRGILVMTSHTVTIDPTQKICKMVRQLSIRTIGATEPEGTHVEKKQRGC